MSASNIPIKKLQFILPKKYFKQSIQNTLKITPNTAINKHEKNILKIFQMLEKCSEYCDRSTYYQIVYLKYEIIEMYVVRVRERDQTEKCQYRNLP